MDETMQVQLQVYGIAMIPVVLGLVEVMKRLGLPTKWAPLASLALGLVFSFFYLAPGEPGKAILTGIVVGLGASGLWSGSKTTMQALRS